jgi:hypothetical protein
MQLNYYASFTQCNRVRHVILFSSLSVAFLIALIAKCLLASDKGLPGVGLILGLTYIGLSAICAYRIGQQKGQKLIWWSIVLLSLPIMGHCLALFLLFRLMFATHGSGYGLYLLVLALPVLTYIAILIDVTVCIITACIKRQVIRREADGP